MKNGEGGIAIVANEVDPHADLVIARLREKRSPPILRLDLETMVHRYSYSFNPPIGAGAFRNVAIPNHAIHLDQIKTAWWRRSSLNLEANHREFPTTENLDAIEAYWAGRWWVESLPDSSFPLGHPRSMHTSGNKIRQLALAASIGMTVPETIISNDKIALDEFARRHDELVLKPLRVSSARDRNLDKIVVIKSATIKSESLRRELDANGTVHLFCQHRVAKKADIRINVFPQRTFACLIDTSSLPEDEVDWRSRSLDLNHSLIDISDTLESQCRRFLKAQGLRWGAFDFGLTDDDEFVFFECNPNGQWLWVELKTGAPISETIANELREHLESSIE